MYTWGDSSSTWSIDSSGRETNIGYKMYLTTLDDGTKETAKYVDSNNE